MAPNPAALHGEVHKLLPYFAAEERTPPSDDDITISASFYGGDARDGDVTTRSGPRRSAKLPSRPASLSTDDIHTETVCALHGATIALMTEPY